MSDINSPTTWYKIKMRTSVIDVVQTQSAILKRVKQTDATTGNQKGFAVFSALEYHDNMPQESYHILYFSPVASMLCVTLLGEFSALQCETAPSRDEDGLRVVWGDEVAAWDLLK